MGGNLKAWVYCIFVPALPVDLRGFGGTGSSFLRLIPGYPTCLLYQESARSDLQGIGGTGSFFLRLIPGYSPDCFIKSLLVLGQIVVHVGKGRRKQTNVIVSNSCHPRLAIYHVQLLLRWLSAAWK